MGCISAKISKTVQVPQVRSISVYNTTLPSQEDKSSPQSTTKIPKKVSFDGLQEILSFSPSMLDFTNVSSYTSLCSYKIPLTKDNTKAHSIVFHLATTLPAKSFNFYVACKKGIKYISKVTLTGSHTQNLNKDKVGQFLKRLKVCRSLNLMENITSLPAQKKLKLRKLTLGLAKSIKTIGSSKITNNLSHLKAVQACHVNYISQISFLPALMCLKISRLISQKNNEKAIKRLSRLKNLRLLHIKTEDLSTLASSQRDLSRAIKKLTQLKKINLQCSLTSQPNQHVKQNPPEIYPRLSLWQKIGELSLEVSNNNAFSLKSMLGYLKRFESLSKLSLKLKSENPEEFSVYQEFSVLEQLKELCLEVKSSNGFRKEMIRFFDCTMFPKGLRLLNIKLTALSTFSVLSRASKECNFFESLENLRSLSSFRFSVKAEEVTPKPSHIKSPFIFFHYLIKHLPKQLQNLNISAYNSVSSSCWSPMISQDRILNVISERLNYLETLKLNILGVNLAPESLENKVLPKLKTISLGNLLLSPGLFSSFYTQKLGEFKFSSSKDTEIADLEWFLREIGVFTSLTSLKIKTPKLKSQKITGGLAKELLKLFQNFNKLREFSLVLPSITVGAEAAKWFWGVCQCKKSLRLCKLEFRDYKITKDVFCTNMTPC